MTGRSDTHQRGQASEGAVSAAAWTLGRTTQSGRDYDGPFNIEDYMRQAGRVAAAMHDPALGEDRSVRLGDVLDALREHFPAIQDGPSPADTLACEFGAPDAGDGGCAAARP